jgi:multiple sugar transport system ATP-binding protein
LRDGVLQQVDTPTNLFRHPVNLFVAAFIGSPSMNFVQGRVANGSVNFADVTIPLPAGSALAGSDRQVVVGIRPTGFSTATGDGLPTMKAVPDVVEDLGDERYIHFDVDAPRVDTEATRAAVDAKSAEDILLLPEDRARFTVRLPVDTPVTAGQPVTLTVSPDRLHFFDPESGATL